MEAQNYKISLPNGQVVEKVIEQEEAEYWISLGMYSAHGFQVITAMFMAEEMDDEATVEGEVGNA